MNALQGMDRYCKEHSSEHMYRNVLKGSIYLYDNIYNNT